MRGLAFLLLPVLGILAFDPVPPDDHAVKYVVLGAGALGCLLLRRRLRWTDLAPALCLFVVARGVMILNSPWTGEAVRWWLLLLALAVVHLAAPPRWLRRNAPLVLGPLCLVVSLIAIGQGLGGERQAHATFANRNFAAAGIAMLVPFALATGWRWLFLAAALGGLLATQSRGGSLAAAAALALWFTWERPRLRAAALLAVPAAVLAAGLLFGEADTVKVRLLWYGQAAKMGAAHPVLGVGAGGFAREYPPVRPIEEHAISGGRRVHAVHNDYLESFAEGGAVGLAAHLFLLLAAARAARRSRVAACSLLAFAVASLVDLPLRDPSLLALAFLALSLTARKGRPAGTPWPWVAAVALSLWVHGSHWIADRSYGEAALDTALSWEGGHRDALLTRGRPEDLAEILRSWPHDADARYNRTRGLPKEQAVEALWDILRSHDPHHTLTRVRLAQLVREEDPVQAAAVLGLAIAADPRPYRPYLVMARIHREGGRLDEAGAYLEEAAARSADPLIALERLELALARGDAVEPPVRALPPDAVERRIEEALGRAAAIENGHPRPRVPRGEDESVASHVQRVQEALDRWRGEVGALTRPHYREALTLAAALCRADPAAPRFRLLARAARGLDDVAGARVHEATALFLEALAALLRADEYEAGERWRRAVRAHPGLPREKDVARVLGQFAGAHPETRPMARRLFEGYPELVEALG